jgi:histidine-containing phosphotransfer peotein
MAQLESLNHGIDQLVYQLQQEGVLDEQFQQLMLLQDETNPDFVAEVVDLFFQDSVTKIDRMGQLVQTLAPDYNELDQLVHQFKGSSASLGAQQISKLCVHLRESCQQRDRQGCEQLVNQIRDAFIVLKQRLDLFMQLDTHRKSLMNGQA